MTDLNTDWDGTGLENLEIEYIPGNAAEFVVFIQNLGDAAQIKSIEGHARWVITREDGMQYIARPWDVNPNK